MARVRKYIFILLILVGAGCISWWSARNESQVVHYVQSEVTKLVPRFISDPTSIETIVVDPILEPILASTLRQAFSSSIELDQNIVVTVVGGDDSFYGDGSATHVTFLLVNGRPIAGLRIICESTSDPLLIAGVFKCSANEVNTQ